MLGASGQRDDFPAARILHWRFLASFFLPEQQFQNWRRKVFMLIYKTKTDTHLHQKKSSTPPLFIDREIYSRFLCRPWGGVLFITFRVIVKIRRWYTSLDVAMSHLNHLFHDATFKWTEYSVINKTLDISASKTILSSWVWGEQREELT